MIISFTKKFIFFRPKKVGSTTIEYHLSKLLRHPDIWIKDLVEDTYFYRKKKIKSSYPQISHLIPVFHMLMERKEKKL